MWYHAVTDFASSTRYWWNRNRDELVADLLIPVLSKQVIVTNRRGKKVLFNFGSVSYVTIVKTAEKLVRSAKGKPPSELSNKAFVTEHNVTEEFMNDLRLIQSHHLTRSLIQQAVSEPLNQMFVVMKFGDAHLDSAYEGVLKPVGESFGYKVLRVDEIQDSGNISAQILENISRSKIIFVELSGGRPNCYYEAGYAHALGKELIFAIRRGEAVHFDLAPYRFIMWETEADLRHQLMDRLNASTSRAEE